MVQVAACFLMFFVYRENFRIQSFGSWSCIDRFVGFYRFGLDLPDHGDIWWHLPLWVQVLPGWLRICEIVWIHWRKMYGTLISTFAQKFLTLRSAVFFLFLVSPLLQKGARSHERTDSFIVLQVWVVVSNIFCFHPYLGKVPILTNIFQRGWNHQQEVVFTREIYDRRRSFPPLWFRLVEPPNSSFLLVAVRWIFSTHLITTIVWKNSVNDQTASKRWFLNPPANFLYKMGGHQYTPWIHRGIFLNMVLNVYSNSYSWWQFPIICFISKLILEPTQPTQPTEGLKPWRNWNSL